MFARIIRICWAFLFAGALSASSAAVGRAGDDGVVRVKSAYPIGETIERLKNDKAFWGTSRGGPLANELDWDGLLDPMKYVGRSVEQTERFIKEVVEPLREQYGEAIAKLGESAPKV